MKKNYPFDFLALNIVTIFMFLPVMSQTYFLRHDTLFIFEIFHFYYSELFFNHQLPQWMPYGMFGIPGGYYQLNALSPVNYASFLFGWIFQIKDALFLFKLSILFEKLIFLTGMYLVSRLIFVHRKTVFIVCLAAVNAGFFWQEQVLFGHRIYYMFPWVLYFLILFFQKEQPKYIWLAGIALFSWFLGNLPYCLMLWAFVLFIIFAVLAWHRRHAFKCLFKLTPYDGVLIGILAAVIWACFCQLKSTTGTALLLARSTAEGKTNLTNFLTYGDPLQAGVFFKNLAWGDPAAAIGIIPLLFLFWALVIKKTDIAKAVLTATLCLFWLSLGGFFAAAVYFFPGMSFYRHIGLVFCLLKVLILFTAGFALDDFWKLSLRDKSVRLLVGAGVLILLSDIFQTTGKGLEGLANARGDSTVNMMVHGGALLVMCCLAGYAAFRRRSSGDDAALDRRFNTASAVIILSAFIWNIASSHAQALKSFRNEQLDRQNQELLYTTKVHKIQYRSQRTLVPEAPRSRDALALTTGPNRGMKYSTAYNFSQFDPCRSEFRSDFMPREFERLMKTRRAVDVDLLAALGCNVPKLRLAPNATVLDSAAKAESVISSQPKIFSMPVIHGQVPPRQDGISLPEESINVEEFSADHLKAEVQVPYPQGAWLVYADSYADAWKVTVDSKRTDLGRAYLNFKAVFLPAGKHQVRFDYGNFWVRFFSYFIGVFGVAVCFSLLTAQGLILSGSKVEER